MDSWFALSCAGQQLGTSLVGPLRQWTFQLCLQKKQGRLIPALHHRRRSLGRPAFLSGIRQVDQIGYLRPSGTSELKILSISAKGPIYRYLCESVVAPIYKKVGRYLLEKYRAIGLRASDLVPAKDACVGTKKVSVPVRVLWPNPQFTINLRRSINLRYLVFWFESAVRLGRLSNFVVWLLLKGTPDKAISFTQSL